MLTLKPISTVPLGERVLLYWLDLDHLEEGRICQDEGFEPPCRYHVLFSGESMSFEPSHWAPWPDIELS